MASLASMPGRRVKTSVRYSLGVGAKAAAFFDDGVEDPPYPANAERANIPTIPRNHPKVWAFCNW